MITRDGRRMVVVGYDGITVRDAATLAVLERLPGAGVSASLTASPLRFQTVSAPYALSSDDRTVAIGDTDGSLRLLELETGDVRTAVRPPRRGRQRRPLHPGRPLGDHDRRRRRRHRLGRAPCRGRERRCPATPGSCSRR